MIYSILYVFSDLQSFSTLSLHHKMPTKEAGFMT